MLNIHNLEVCHWCFSCNLWLQLCFSSFVIHCYIFLTNETQCSSHLTYTLQTSVRSQHLLSVGIRVSVLPSLHSLNLPGPNQIHLVVSLT